MDLNDTLNKLNNLDTSVSGLKKIGSTKTNTSTVSNVSSSSGTTKTSYQQNVAKPISTASNNSTSRSMLGKITDIASYNPSLGSVMMQYYNKLQQTPTSKYYDPYTQATNRSVSNLASLGIDTSKIDDEWFEQTKWLDDYLVYNGTTNTPSSPGKKATAEQNAAYERYQIGKANDLTNKAKTEWAALQEEATFLANWSDRNYSDDEIIDKIYGTDGSNFAKKYPTLASMDDSLKPGGTLLELNEGIDYSKDNLYGVLWAARNGGGTGNIWADVGYSALGYGNAWKEDPSISERLNNKSDKYAPYTVGSTMDEACIYFNRSSFDDNWLENNKPDGTDKTETDLWNRIYDAEQFTKDAEAEVADLERWLNDKLSSATNPEDVMNTFESRLNSKYQNLLKMKNSQDKVDSLLDTTRAINFSYNDVQRRIYEACAQNSGKPNSAESTNKPQYLASSGTSDASLGMPTKTDVDTEAKEQEALNSAADALGDEATQQERDALIRTGGMFFERAINAVVNFSPLKVLSDNDNIKRLSSSYTNDSVGNYKAHNEYENASLAHDLTQATIAEMQNRVYANEDELSSIQSIWRLLHPGQSSTTGNGDTQKYSLDDYTAFKGMVDKIQDIRANGNGTWYENEDGEPSDYYLDLYNMVTGSDADLGDPEAEYKIKQAKSWLNYLTSDNETVGIGGDYDEDKIRELKSKDGEYVATMDQYKEQWGDYNRANESKAAMSGLLNAIGVSSKEMEISNTVTDYITSFSKYTPWQWESYDVYTKELEKAGEGATYDSIKKWAEENHQEDLEKLDDLNWIKKYCEDNGVSIPDEYKRRMDLEETRLNFQLEGYDYFMLRTANDFDATAEKGKALEDQQKAKAVGMETFGESEEVGYFLYGLDHTTYYDRLTEDERNTYYYLYATKGAEAAYDYVKDYLDNDSYGFLDTRLRNEQVANANAEVNGGILGAIWANTKAVLSAPLDSIMSFSYMLDTLISGEEFNPNNAMMQFGQYSSSVNQATTEAINEAFKDNDTARTVVGGLYEILYNRVRSAVNGVAFGGFTGGISNEILQELVGAAPMAFSAMAESMSDAKRRGAEDWQMWTIGAITFICEDFTEGLTYGNIKDAIEGANGMVSGGFKAAVKDWLTSSGWEEMLGETFTEIVEKQIDYETMGENSNYNNRLNEVIAEMKKNNPQLSDEKIREMAEEQVNSEELNDILYTALISYLSPGADVPMSFVSNYFQQEKYARKAVGVAKENGEELSLRDAKQQYKLLRGDMEAIANADEHSLKDAIAGVLNDGEEGGSVRAAFAAENLMATFGKETSGVLLNIMQTAQKTGANVSNLKEAIQTASLSKNSAAYRVITSMEFTLASPEQQQKMLLGTLNVDRNNGAVQHDIETAQRFTVEDADIEFPAEMTVEQQVEKDVASLTSMETGNEAANTAAMVSVFGGKLGTATGDAAKAAASSLSRLFGGNTAKAVTSVKNLLLGAAKSGSAETLAKVKQALQTATLSESSEARKTMGTTEYVTASAEQQAAMLADTVDIDQNNGTVQQETADAVHEARIAEIEKPMILNGALAKTKEAENARDNANAELNKSKERLNEAINVLEAKSNAVVAATEAVAQDPSVENVRSQQAALSDLNAANEMRDQAEANVDNQQKALDEAQSKYNEVRNQERTALRQQAEEALAQEDQQRAEAEQQRLIEEEAQAKVKAQMLEMDNFTKLNAEDIVDELFPNISDEDRKYAIQTVMKIQKEGSSNFDSAMARRDFAVSFAKRYGLKGYIVKNAPFNARVNPKTGVLEVSSNATQSDIMYAVMIHELTHIAENAGIDTYKELADAVLKLRYGEDASYDSILEQMEKGDLSSKAAQDIIRRKERYDKFLKGRGEGGDTSYEYNLREIVADEVGYTIAQDQEALNRIAQEKPSLARRILDSIKSFLQKVAGLEGEPITQAQNVANMLEEALKKVEGTKGKQKYSLSEDGIIAEDSNGNVLATELPGGTVSASVSTPATDDDGVRYSLSSWTDKEKKTVRKNLLKNGFTASDIDRWMNDINSVAAVIAADKDRLDFTPDRDQKFKKPNGDVYKWTLDASTLCAKRLLYQGTFNKIQKALADVPLRPGDLIDLANMMHEMGYQTPCGICYVESRRRHLGNFTEEFLNGYDGEYKPTYAELTSTDGLAKLKQEHRQAYDDYIAAMNGKGVASPKVVQLRTDYRGDVRSLTKDSVKYLNNNGGLRINSFSDFETPHLMDMMQAVLDMSAVGLKSQAYTKVPNFAWVFGDTGIKINLSLMGDGNGIGADGKLSFSNTEGMEFEEAMKIRNRYSQNVGTILVGMNDEHIILAMADPRIDYIIPFHRSGWSNEELSRMKTLESYTDYQDTQNEVWIVGQNEDGSYITKSIDKKTGNLDPYGEEGYWEYDKSGQWNAEKYLRLCAEQKRLPKFSQFLTDNGDGTFSLPSGDDARSTAIREGYWKTLIDFKMYENDSDGSSGRSIVYRDGNFEFAQEGDERTERQVVGSEQGAVHPDVNMNQAMRVLGEYKAPVGGNNALPSADPVVDRFVEAYKTRRESGNKNESLMNFPARGTAASMMSMDMTLGNAENNTEEVPQSKQNAMAIDAETGETVRYSLPAEIDNVFNDMSIDELRQLLGFDEDTSEEETRTVLTNAVEDIKDEFDPTIYNGRLYVKPETLDFWLSGSGFASSNPNYAQAYITTMNPADFLRMTTASEVGQQRILDEATPLDEERLSENAQRQPIQLNIDEENGLIVGHEGRHRAVALSRAGVTEMPVLLFDSSTKYSKTAKDEMTLQGQSQVPNADNGNMITFADVVPLSTANRDEITQRFTASAEDETAATENGQRVLRYSLPSDDAYLSAVENGDTETAQRIVDETAQKNGYSVEMAYHGTKMFGFTEFDMDRGNGMIFVAYSDKLAGTYIHSGAVRNIREEEQSDVTYDPANPEQIIEIVSNEKIKYKDPENEFHVHNINSIKQKDDNNFIITVSTGKTYTVTGDELADSINTTRNRNKFKAGGIYKLYTRTGKQLVVDAQGSNWNDIAVDWSDSPQTTRMVAEYAKGHGYDSVRINNVFDNGGHTKESFMESYGDIGIFFNQSDVKSADTATYDGNGNIILPSERFNTEEKDIRYSLPAVKPSDAPYLSAVDRGDMETAQRMVDEKSEESGYAIDAFHGTVNGGYTIFDKQKAHVGGNSGAGFYFSSNRNDSEANYSDIEGADNHFKVEHLAEKIQEYISESGENEYAGVQIPEDASFEDLEEIAKKMLQGKSQTYHVRLNPGRAYIRDGNNSTNLIEDTINNFDESLYNPNDYESEDEYYDAITEARSDEIYQAVSDAVYNGIADVDSNYEIISNIDYEKIINDLAMVAIDYEKLTMGDLIDMIGRQEIDAIVGDGEESADATAEVARAIVEAFGFDSIEDREVGWKFNQIKNMGIAGDTVHYIMFHPNQIKLADAVTYDNDGNVIPLSERFKQGNNDIRYALPSAQFMEQQIRDRLANGMSTGENGNLPGMPIEENGSAQRQFGSQTAQESDALHNDVKDYLYTHSSYTPETNREQIDRAIDWVKSHANENDTDGFFGAMQEAQSGNFNAISADGQARMLTLMSMAALKGEKTGDHSAELVLADLFNKQGTEAGRALQARQIFRMMTPVGRMATLNRMADQINEEYGRNANERRVRLSDWTLQAAAVAETEEDFERVRKAATKELAEQMPANWKEKLSAWRMLSMLGNPRTHVRNVLGNWMFMPVVGLKNKIGATLESAFIKKSNITGQPFLGEERTKTIGLATRDAREFAKADATTMESVLRGEAKYSEGTKVQQERKMFGQGNGIVSKTAGWALQKLVDLNGKALEGEDWIFLKRHYRNALAGWMTANKYTSEDLTNNPVLLQTAREYAVQEAQKATYRDANELATWLNNVKNPVAKFVVNAVLPFKKTPANILKRGVEYSPVSLIRSFTTDIKHLNEWKDYQSGKLSVLPDKAISPTQYIDRISAGLSGTLIMVAGGLLSSLGVVRAGLDDDDDEFEKLNGSQKYSIEIGGISITADWAAPMSMPFFVGATVMDEIKKLREGNEFSVGDVLDAMLGISEPVFNLSMLDGVNSLLNTNQYSDGNNITQIGEKVVTNYFTSYVPTILGQAARSIDTTRRMNYVESGADLSVFRSAWEQVENKIPWLSQTNIPYRNVWGEADVSEPVWAAIENFISPGYGNRVTNDPVTNELQRIYEATGDKNMIPKTASKTVSIGGKTVRLNAEQYDQYVTDRGQTAKQCLTDLMESPIWQICDDGTRAMMVTDAWTYANQIARNRLDQNGKLDSWVASAEHNGNFVDVVTDRAAESNRKDYIAGYGLTMAEALNYSDGEMYDLSLTALDEAEATEAEIRAPLRDYFKPLYQQAFKENDRNTMLEIEDKLVDAGVGFKASTFEGWIPSEEDEEKETDTRWLNNDLRSDMDNSMMPIYQAAMASGDTAKMEQIEQMLLNSGLGYTDKDFEAWKQR